MKKIIITTAAIFFPLLAYCQLKAVKVADPVTNIVSTYSLSHDGAAIDLIEADDTTAYVLILTTSNRYDDRMVFVIGGDKASAMTSIRGIASLLDEEIGTRYELEQSGGCMVGMKVINSDPMFPKSRGLFFSAKGYAGGVILTRTQFKKLIKGLSEYGNTSHRN